MQPLYQPNVDNPNEDPVCHTIVATPRTAPKSLYRGGVYYFCCKQCKKEFDQNPQLWLSVSHAEMVSANHGVL